MQYLSGVQNGNDTNQILIQKLIYILQKSAES